MHRIAGSSFFEDREKRADKGKPVERPGRKALDLRSALRGRRLPGCRRRFSSDGSEDDPRDAASQATWHIVCAVRRQNSVRQGDDCR
jgi:hypothetical protein